MASSKGDEQRAAKYFQNGKINSPLLVNKQGLTTFEGIQAAEAAAVEYSQIQGLSEAAHELTPDGLKAMHKEMFEPVYEWAGTFRDYTTGRGEAPFCRPDYIDKSLGKIYDKLNDELSPGMPPEEFAKTSAEFIGELNSVHPFVDGNGRTQRATLGVIAESVGYEIDTNSLDRGQWYTAAQESHSYAVYDQFETLIKDAIEEQQEKQVDNDRDDFIR